MTAVVSLDAPIIDLKKNITWQYDAAPNFNILADKKQSFYDDQYGQFWSSWFRGVFDLKDFPSAMGITIWSIILGVPPGAVDITAARETFPFGFGHGRRQFWHGNFVKPLSPLTIDEARRILRMKYYAQTMSPTVANINYALADVFGDLGAAYIDPKEGATTPVNAFGFGPYQQNFNQSNFNSDTVHLNMQRNPMTQTYVFTFSLSSGIKSALEAYDILPRGSGVSSLIVSP